MIGLTIAYHDESTEYGERELARFAEGQFTVCLTPSTEHTYSEPARPGPRDVRILAVVTGEDFQWYGSVRVVDLDDDGKPAGDPYVVVADRVEVY